MHNVKRNLSTRIDGELLEKIKQFAEKENRYLSNMVETILKNYLKERKENPDKEVID